MYFHDGQNPIEEATFSNGPTRGAYTEIVRNGLGARGIDYVEVFKTGSATSVRFPVYDGHGNMTACLLRDGAGGFTLTSRRAYDPWGAMRQWGTHPSGASAYQGAPSNRYVGSLGHQQDDDSGLYYMRARYYEPGSGRFISEDPARDGGNWFAYCDNDPVNFTDATGKEVHRDWAAMGVLSAALSVLLGWVTMSAADRKGFAVALICSATLAHVFQVASLYCFWRALGGTDAEAKGLFLAVGGIGAGIAKGILRSLEKSLDSVGLLGKICGYVGLAAATAASAYIIAITAALLATMVPTE